MLPDFELRQVNGASIWISRRYANERFLEILRDADGFFADASCQIVKDQRKIKVGRVLVDVDGRSQTLFIKRYNVYSIRNHLVWPFMDSGAFRALRGAALLRAADIQTAVPVAAVENHSRFKVCRSFFITEEIADGKTLDAYWREDLGNLAKSQRMIRKRDLLIQLGSLFRLLHGSEIYHNDLKDANILVVADQHTRAVNLFLLDLEGVKRFAALRAGRKIKNVVQLNRTFGRYLRRVEKLVFLRSYMGRCYQVRKVRRQLIQKVVHESRRIDREKAKIVGRTANGTVARLD